MKKQKFSVHSLSHKRYKHTVWWSIFLAVLIVAIASALGRAAHNFQAALTDKPDVALYLLLPKEQIGQSTVIRQTDTERDYLADTKDGQMLISLKKGQTQWYVSHTEALHE